MQSLQKLFNYEGKRVRTTTKGEQILFVAKDVCDVLEIKQYRDAVSRLSEKQRELVKVDTLGGIQTMTAITEAGVYKLVFRSNKPEAEKFTDWIAEEVIPSIRKTGKYEVQKPMSIEDMIITQAESVKKLKQEVAQIKTVVDNEVWVNERQKKQIQDSVSRRVFELRQKGHDAHFQTLYSSLKRFFGVSKYDKIPRKDFDEAISFIKGWYPPVKKQYAETR